MLVLRTLNFVGFYWGSSDQCVCEDVRVVIVHIHPPTHSRNPETHECALPDIQSEWNDRTIQQKMFLKHTANPSFNTRTLKYSIIPVGEALLIVNYLLTVYQSTNALAPMTVAS